MATPELSTENSKKKPGLAQVLVPVALIVVLVVSALWVLKSRTGKHADTHDDEAHFTMAEGKTLPDLELENLAGEKLHLSQIHAKVVLVNFWATWCGPCIQEMPSLDRLYREYKNQGLEVLAINMDENPANKVPQFMEKNALSFQSYIDPKGVLSDRLNIEGLPFTFVIDSERKILYSHLGDEDWFSRQTRSRFKKWLGIEGA